MSIPRHSESAFESVIEAHLLANGYVTVAGHVFDRERAIFLESVLTSIREPQPKEWAKPESLHGVIPSQRLPFPKLLGPMLKLEHLSKPHREIHVPLRRPSQTR